MKGESALNSDGFLSGYEAREKTSVVQVQELEEEV